MLNFNPANIRQTVLTGLFCAATIGTITAGTTPTGPVTDDCASSELIVSGGQTPFAGVISLPGTIEAENFDADGPDDTVDGYQGAFDKTAGNVADPGNTYRPGSDVDIQDRFQRVFVTALQGQEYLEFTVNATEGAGNYNFEFVASSLRNANRTVQVQREVCDPATMMTSLVDLGTVTLVLTTGGDAVFASTTLEDVALIAGEQVLRLTFGAFGGALDQVIVTKGTGGPVDPTVQGPFNGPNTFVDGTLVLEVENYDTGGQDVAYNDTGDTPADNSNNTYRPGDGVDVRSFGPAIVINDNTFNEWQEYTIDVPAAAQYVFEFRYFTGRDGVIRVEADFDAGNTTPVEVTLPAGGVPADFVMARSQPISLGAGVQVLRFTVAGGGYNLDKVTIAEVNLPVDWMSFTGAANQKSVNLAWTTANEVENEGFTVQRSQNGAQWEALGFVGANETSSYRFADQRPVSGTNLYRLQQRDYDGTTDLSSVIQVSFAADLETRLYPNPTTNRIEFATQQTIANARLLDVTGRTLRIVPGNVRGLDVQDLASGTYYLQLQGADSVETLRFVKK
ncbi:T9SS type A sorting domain-containing protein [Neolewinella antarctica]|uniref:CBM6 domain-containing protein n=1 Tax=Neolewinella antarctica TaxID=442734 RepID=A0ABX0XHZ9_9BACT|nr:T9SS type A sorting domain-containing protein [Neolewinella antarctica]NJC28454.1 hypothetical protein [Neolewinella antarctica]